MDILLGIDAGGLKFSVKLPYDKQLIEDERRYHYISLRRILTNSLAERKGRRFSMIPSFVSYSSSNLVASLMEVGDLVRAMKEADLPFSLLAKLKTYDYDNPEENMFVITRPLLVIPSVNQPDITSERGIDFWEQNNTRYQMESWPFRRMINRYEYLLINSGLAPGLYS